MEKDMILKQHKFHKTVFAVISIYMIVVLLYKRKLISLLIFVIMLTVGFTITKNIWTSLFNAILVSYIITVCFYNPLVEGMRNRVKKSKKMKQNDEDDDEEDVDDDDDDEEDVDDDDTDDDEDDDGDDEDDDDTDDDEDDDEDMDYDDPKEEFDNDNKKTKIRKKKRYKNRNQSKNEDGDENEDILDINQSFVQAYKKMSPKQLSGLTKETKDLINTQKKLMETLNTMGPALKEGKQILSTFKDYFGNERDTKTSL